MNDDHQPGGTRDRNPAQQPSVNSGPAGRTLRTGYKARRERNEREALEKWRTDAAPPMPPDEPPSEKSLWGDEAPPQVGEILIGAGKAVKFKLDEEKQNFELENDLEKITVPKVRTLAHAVKDLIARTVPGTAGTIAIHSLFRLDPEASKATPAIRLRFKYVANAMHAVDALESRIRHLMDLVGSATDTLFLISATELLPSESEAPLVVALAKQIRTAAPRAAVAPCLEMTSTSFQAPVTVPARIGPPPPQDEVTAEVVEKEGEVVGYLRPERLAFVLFPGRSVSTTCSANMEVFFPILQQEAPIIGNKCLIRYRPDQDGRDGGKGTLLRVEVLWQSLFSEPPELTIAELPEVVAHEQRQNPRRC